MPSKRISAEDASGMYFLTLTVVKWYYLFDRQHRWRILLQSLKHCQTNKGLQVFAYVFMLNHIHLIVKSPDVSGFLRDFKKFTSKKILENIAETEHSTLRLFTTEDDSHQLWQPTNMPVLIESEKVFFQKKEYIEQNPVRKEYVSQPEHWMYSSAFCPNLLDVAGLDEL